MEDKVKKESMRADAFYEYLSTQDIPLWVCLEMAEVLAHSELLEDLSPRVSDEIDKKLGIEILQTAEEIDAMNRRASERQRRASLELRAEEDKRLHE